MSTLPFIYQILIPLFLLSTTGFAENPLAMEDRGDRIFLTWKQDPLTTMTLMNLKVAEPLPPVETSTPHQVIVALPQLGDVHMDGTAADWWENGLALQFLADLEGLVPAPSDLQAEFRMGWTEKGLLIAVRVQDDQPLEADTLPNLWQADCIELFVADGRGSPRRYQALVAPGTDPRYAEPRYHLLQHTPPTEPQAEKLNLEVKRSLNARGYTMEILMPWSNLPSVDPTLGTELALQLHVVDLDGDTRTPYIWYPGGNASSNSQHMEWIRLEEQASEPIQTQVSIREERDASVIQVLAGEESTGRIIQVRSGDTVLGESTLETRENRSLATLSLPPPPDGFSWGTVQVWIGDRLLTTLQTPALYPDLQDQTRSMTYWETDAKKETTRTATLSGQAVRNWDGRHILQKELTGLTPGTAYRFQLDGDPSEYGFRTLPTDLGTPLRLAFGGDVRHQKSWMDTMNRVIMSHRPQAIIWGGDLAYANGLEQNTDLWQEWFDSVHTTLRDAENTFVPLILGIGNHEVQKGYHYNHPDYEQTDEWREKIAPFYYQFALFPGQPGYGVLDIGDYLSLLMLDTGHSNPVEGVQTEWLTKTLSERKQGRHLIPVYHVPAWPSVRDFNGTVSTALRSQWVPLFEQADVRIAFEHHDHVYKRTPPLRAGKEDESGIVYLGDGSWGVGARTAHDVDDTWYLEHTANVRHGIILTLDQHGMKAQAFSEHGNLIDEVRIQTLSTK